ncbi:hypothetical protein HAX54_048138 [Datura stramonium]|uniref:Uncharacterized protein n=1 Tax=Datura stramonium TaxID=4076 RepID=A0ABS8Y6P0_DATST|nr:hypothetical protein [Datura stramonium]
MWSNGEALLSERAKCGKTWLDGCSRQGMKMASGWETRQGVAEDLAHKTGRWRQIMARTRLRTCAHLVATDRRMALAGHACTQWDDSRAIWACARAWALACTRTQQARRENRSRQLRQAHARAKCGVRPGPGRRSSHEHAASGA